MIWLGVLAAAVGVVPLLWARGLARRGGVIPDAYWWMTAAFGVSFVADVTSLFLHHRWISQLYPVMQAALFIIVLVPSRRRAEWIIAALLAVAASSVVLRDGEGLDTALHLAAWGSIAVCAGVEARGLLRVTLVVGFWALSMAWLAFTFSPDWWTWGAMQTVRLATAAAWCVAATRAVRHA